MAWAASRCAGAASWSSSCAASWSAGCACGSLISCPSCCASFASCSLRLAACSCSCGVRARRRLARLRFERLVARVLLGLQLRRAPGERLETLLLPQPLQQLERALEVPQQLLVLALQVLQARLRRAALRVLERLLQAAHRVLELLRLDLVHDLGQLAQLARELLVEGAALGGLLEALPQLARGLVDLAGEVLLAVERALHLLLPLEGARTAGGRRGRLAGQLVERLLQLLRAVRHLLERALHRILVLVQALVQLGERGEAQLVGGARRHPAPVRRVVEELEAEARALPGQQTQRGGVPARGGAGLARLAREARERQVRPLRVRALAHLEPQLGQAEVVLAEHLVGHLLAGRQVQVALGHAHGEDRRGVGERLDGIAEPPPRRPDARACSS